MTEPDAHRRRRITLRRLIGASALVSAGVIVIVHPVSFSSSTNVFADRVSTAEVIVQPMSLTISAPVSSGAPVAPLPSTPTLASGKHSATAPLSVHVRVLPGKAQWLADPSPQLDVGFGDNARILSGKVLYAVGDNHAWALIAHVTGADGRGAQTRCNAADSSPVGTESNVSAGVHTTISSAPIVVCTGLQGHSGGVFVIALDLDGQPSGDITVTVELVI